MAYSITLAHSRGLINDEQRDQWFTLITSVGLSIDHVDFTEELIAVATEAIKYVISSLLFLIIYPHFSAYQYYYIGNTLSLSLLHYLIILLLH
jgi:hypothetical protein